MNRKLASIVLTIALATSTTTCDAAKQKKEAEAKKWSGEIVLRHDVQMLTVGTLKGDIRPGTYISKGGKNCHWQLMRNVQGEGSTTYTNTKGDSGGGKNTTVHISKLDEYFTSKGCGIWRKAVK
jgi:hypothetical protein